MRINLIPQEEKKVNVGSKVLKTLIISLSMIVLLASTLAVRFFWDILKLNNLEADDQVLKSKEESLKDFKESFEKYKSHPALTLLANHAYYSKLLNKLDDINSEKVKVTNIQIDENFLVNMNAETQGGIAEISRFLKALKKAGFEEPVIKSISTQSTSTSFSLNFKISKQMVLK